MTPEEWSELKYLCRVLLAKRELHHSQCEGKVSFTSRAHAHQGIQPSKRGILDVYQCSSCHLWHVGSQTDQRKKVISRENYIRSRFMRMGDIRR